jgi:hypothetical protein
MATARLKKITAGKLNLEFFNKIIDRIEGIKPLAGNLIKIAEETDGIRISLDNVEIKELNVCKDGAPDTIKVFVQKA